MALVEPVDSGASPPLSWRRQIPLYTSPFLFFPISPSLFPFSSLSLPPFPSVLFSCDYGSGDHKLHQPVRGEHFDAFYYSIVAFGKASVANDVGVMLLAHLLKWVIKRTILVKTFKHEFRNVPPRWS